MGKRKAEIDFMPRKTAMKKRGIWRTVKHCMLLGFLLVTWGCGPDWTVKGSSFPRESAQDQGLSGTEETRVEKMPTSTPPPSTQARGESDEISRKAEELKQEADRLAQEASGLRKEDQGEGGSSSLVGEGEESSPSAERAGGESGGLQPVPDLSDILFPFDQFSLSDEARAILQKNADWLRSHREARILIEGHCDERGTVEYNLALGERRAQSVKDYLVNLGIPEDRLSIISYGKEKPFALGQTEEAWAQNRRAHFLLRSP